MLVIDENLLLLDQLTDDIVAEILQSETVRHYYQAKKDFQADEALQEQVQELNDNFAYLAFRPELRKLQRAINLNPKVYQLKLAENDLQEVLSELAKQLANAISPNIVIDENLPLRGGKACNHDR